MTERTVAKQTRLEDDAISITSTQSDHYGSTEEFEVEAVLAEKTKNGKKLYLLSWAGYPEEKSTWEPEKNISKEILQQWKQKKKRQAQNLEEPFSVAQFEAKLKRLAVAKEERHKRRKAKKKRLGMPVSESESDVQQVVNDSDSSSEADEDNPIDDVPVAKAERKTKSPTKKKPFKVLVTGSAIQKLGESSDEDARLPTRRNSRQESSAKSSVEPVKPPQNQVPEPEVSLALSLSWAFDY
jgi:chromo domain-containing protein 1